MSPFCEDASSGVIWRCGFATREVYTRHGRSSVFLPQPGPLLLLVLPGLLPGSGSSDVPPLVQVQLLHLLQGGESSRAFKLKAANDSSFLTETDQIKRRLKALLHMQACQYLNTSIMSKSI